MTIRRVGVSCVGYLISMTHVTAAPHLPHHCVGSKRCIHNVVHVVFFGNSAGQGRVGVDQAITTEDGARDCNIDPNLGSRGSTSVDMGHD